MSLQKIVLAAAIFAVASASASFGGGGGGGGALETTQLANRRFLDSQLVEAVEAVKLAQDQVNRLMAIKSQIDIDHKTIGLGSAADLDRSINFMTRVANTTFDVNKLIHTVGGAEQGFYQHYKEFIDGSHVKDASYNNLIAKNQTLEDMYEQNVKSRQTRFKAIQGALEIVDQDMSDYDSRSKALKKIHDRAIQNSTSYLPMLQAAVQILEINADNVGRIQLSVNNLTTLLATMAAERMRLEQQSDEQHRITWSELNKKQMNPMPNTYMPKLANP